MKIFAIFMFFILSLTLGDVAILFLGYVTNTPVWVSYIVGGIWGFYAGTILSKRLQDERR